VLHRGVAQRYKELSSSDVLQSELFQVDNKCSFYYRNSYLADTIQNVAKFVCVHMHMCVAEHMCVSIIQFDRNSVIFQT